MIEIRFYTTEDGKVVINKTLTGLLSVQGTFKESSSIITPEITVKRDDALLDKNYLYIENFKRFYFITDIVIDGNFLKISCDVDVLESFKDDFMDEEQVISRQEYKFNLQLKDEKIQRYGKTFQVRKKIGNSPFNTNLKDDKGRFFTDSNRRNFLLTVTNDE